MIFFLLFSKSINNAGRTLARLLIYLSTILIAVAAVFFVLQLGGYLSGDMDQSKLVFSVDIALPLIVLFTLLLSLCGDAIRMTRKDLDAAETALQAWSKEKKKGKQRFVLKGFVAALFWVLVFLLIEAFCAGVNMINVIIAGLILTGIGWAIVLSIWHLNNKYQDDVETLIKAPRGGGMDSVLSKY